MPNSATLRRFHTDFRVEERGANFRLLDPNQIKGPCDGAQMSGEELAEVRRGMGWSQYFLADVLEIPRSSITHWECGRARVPENIAKAMKDASRRVETVKRALVRVAYRP